MNKDHILFQIGRIQYKVNRILINELKKNNINGIAPSHAEIIGSLLMRGPLQMKEIAEIIDKDKSTITALINKLIAKGYVKKKKDIEDNRINIISLTKKGKSLKQKYIDISKKLRLKAYNGFTSKEKEVIYNLLTRMNKNL